MNMLWIELKKEKRTGIVPVLLAAGLLGAGYAFLNYAVRRETLLHLPLAPMDVLLTQLYGMLCILNMFGVILACGMTYHMEFQEHAIKKLYVLPVRAARVYFCKLLIIMGSFLAATMLQYTALMILGMRNLPSGTFEMGTLIRFALYTFASSMPVAAFMMLAASRFENMGAPLGIGVAGFLSGIALTASMDPTPPLLLLHPFVAMLRPAMQTAAVPDQTVLLFSCAETGILLGVGLWKAQNQKEG